jgi:hypothetical protein
VIRSGQCRTVLLGSLLIIGCGDDAKPNVNGAAGGSAGASGSAGAATSAAGSDNGGSGTVGGAGGAASSAGAGPAPLVPLIEGHLSRFAYRPIASSQPMLETCEAPQAEVGGAGNVSGHAGTFYASPCLADPYLIEGSGDQLTAHRISAGAIETSYEYVHSPVANGEQWTTNGVTFEWRELEALDVPAGSFRDCWQRFSDDLSLDYCRGVGLVRMTSPPNNYVLELTEKNF